MSMATQDLGVLPLRRFPGQLHQQPQFFHHLESFRYMGSFEGKDVYVAEYKGSSQKKVVIVSRDDHVVRTLHQVFANHSSGSFVTCCQGMFWELVRAALAMQGVKQQ